jgi:RNA polymerase sigma-70 factor (ECF subfamily)
MSRIDEVRRQQEAGALPDEDRRSPISAMPRSESPSGSTAAHYRDDILRLLFICCHPDLPATQQIALALRIVSGLSRSSRSPAPSSSARARWSSASPAPRRASLLPTCRSKRRARSSAPSASQRSRR